MTKRDDSSAPTALIGVWIPSHFREMARVAELLAEGGAFCALVVILANYTGYAEHAQRLRSRGIAVLTADEFWRALEEPGAVAPQPLAAVAAEAESGAMPPARGATGAMKRALWSAARAARAVPLKGVGGALVRAVLAPLAPLVRWSLLGAFAAASHAAPGLLPSNIVMQRALVRALPRFLAERRVALLVLPEDNFLYATNAWVRAVHQRGGAAVIVPFTIANVRELAESLYHSPVYDGDTLLNAAVAAAFPRWSHRHKAKRLVLAPEYVVANEALGIAPPAPWLINSGEADAMAVESEYLASYYRRAGIPDRQLRVTGSLAEDAAWRVLREAHARREALYAELGFEAGRPMILCALPPDQLGGAGRPECDFADHAALLAFFVKPLAALADAYNVVLSPHPRIAPEEARRLEAPGVRACTRDVAELIPLASIYVASCSATIRLAVACGIPVVNYDVYRYDYEDFKGIPGVIATQEKDAYVQTVERLARDAGEYARARTAQQAFAAREMRLDGHAGERLLALFDELAAKAPHG